jgi:hypothetical protein
MKSVDQTVFHSAVDAQEGVIRQLLAGSPHLLAITAVSSAGTRISWQSNGDEPPTQSLEAADKMARKRLNGDGFGIGVHGPSHEMCTQIADLVHQKIIALADEKVLELH